MSKRHGKREGKISEKERREQQIRAATPEQRRTVLTDFTREEWANAWMYQTFHAKAQELVAKADDSEVTAILLQKVDSNRFSTLKALMEAHPDKPAPTALPPAEPDVEPDVEPEEEPQASKEEHDASKDQDSH